MTNVTDSNPLDARSLAIRALNDRFRQTFNGGRVVATAGFMALDDAARQRIFIAVQAFDAFDEGNDPWGEHDFGSIKAESPSSSRSTTWHRAARCIRRTRPTRPKPSGS